MSNFAGMRVLALESRRAKEMAALITAYGGQPLLAPAMREVALDSNSQATQFITGLIDGEFDMAIFLTGVGTRLLAEIAANTAQRVPFAAALQRVRVVARGPKPVAALKELGITADVIARAKHLARTSSRDGSQIPSAGAAKSPRGRARVRSPERGVTGGT
jgi:uroporphyrinogen-III synthase